MYPFKKALCFLAGHVYIDTSVLSHNAPTLLHISDTPVRFFPELKRLIETLKPTYIIHTGDLADNIKLQMYPGSIHRYERWVKTLIDLLESSSAETIYLALGNHDNSACVKDFTNRSIVIEVAETLEIEGHSVRISHYPTEILKAPAQLNFFGHDLSLETGVQQDHYFYNGISDIHLIELDTLNVHYFQYPWGTDDDRLCKGRTSL